MILKIGILSPDSEFVGWAKLACPSCLLVAVSSLSLADLISIANLQMSSGTREDPHVKFTSDSPLQSLHSVKMVGYIFPFTDFHRDKSA